MAVSGIPGAAFPPQDGCRSVRMRPLKEQFRAPTTCCPPLSEPPKVSRTPQLSPRRDAGRAVASSLASPAPSPTSTSAVATPLLKRTAAVRAPPCAAARAGTGAAAPRQQCHKPEAPWERRDERERERERERDLPLFFGPRCFREVSYSLGLQWFRQFRFSVSLSLLSPLPTHRIPPLQTLSSAVAPRAHLADACSRSHARLHPSGRRRIASAAAGVGWGWAYGHGGGRAWTQGSGVALAAAVEASADCSPGSPRRLSRRSALLDGAPLPAGTRGAGMSSCWPSAGHRSAKQRVSVRATKWRFSLPSRAVRNMTRAERRGRADFCEAVTEWGVSKNVLPPETSVYP